MGGAPAAELPTMCSYLLQTSIDAAACSSSRGRGLCLGGQSCTGQPWWGPRFPLHALASQVPDSCFMASTSEKRDQMALGAPRKGKDGA
jgi:hypothetical protein